MANTLRFKRGLVSGIPTAALGEPLFTTDTFDLYIGTGAANQRFQKYIASGTTSQLLRGDGSLLTMPIVLTSPANGQVLKYNGTSWVNDSDSGITGSGAAGQVSYWNGTNTQTGSNNLFWDATNGRLGIGTATPSEILHLSGNNNGSTNDSPIATIRLEDTDPAVAGNQPIGKIQFWENDNTVGGVGEAAYILAKSAGSSGGGYMTFGTSIGTVTAVEAGRFTALGNFHIGNYTSDSGQRLQVTGDTLMKGSGNTSGTNALVVQNSAGTNIFNVRNDGAVQIGSRPATQRPYLAGYTAFNEFGVSQTTLGIVTQFGAGTRPDPGILIKNSANLDYTSSAGNFLSLLTNYSPTSGTGVFNNYVIQPTINQTGGANGITRGLFIAPTLTAAANWRSIEWSNTSGWGLYGAGSANNHLLGNTVIGSTTLLGVKFSVFGDSILRGSGNTSATTALLVENSDGSDLLKVKNDGVLLIGNSANAAQLRPVNTSGILDLGGDALGFVALATTNSAGVSSFNFTGTTLTSTSGFNGLISIYRQFAPTSGTAQATYLNINPTINQTGGANGITRGLYIQPTLTAAANWRSIEWSNNTGWGLYGAGTAPSYFGGSVGIGTTALTQYNLRVSKNITGATVSYGIVGDGQIQSGVTVGTINFWSNPSVAASTTTTNLFHFRADQGSIGAGSSVSLQAGFWVDSSLTGATTNYGFYSAIASGTGRWNLYMNGTADNYLRGRLGLNNTNLGNVTLRNSLQISGATSSYGYFTDAVIQSGVTSSASYFHIEPQTQAASFTLTNLYGYYLGNPTIGSGNTTTNVYGFYGNIASGTNRWNLYMNGSANNFISGNTQIGTGAFTSEKLQVNGTMKVTGASTFGDNSTISKNYNGETKLTISNTTSGDSSVAYISLVSSNGLLNIGKRSSTLGVYKFLAVNDSQIYNNTSGDIAILNDFATGSIKMAAGGSSTAHFTIASTGAATFSSSIQAATAIAIGTTPDTNKPFKILKNINATVGINFENTSTSSLAFSAIQMGTDVTGGTKFTNLVYASSGVSASGVYNPDGTSLINNGGGGLNFLGTPTRFYTGGGNGVLRLLFDNEGTTQFTATTPTTNATDGYKQYSADIVAGNAAPHFRTENGAVIKLYQETTGVGNAIISLGGGSSVLDDTTFDGYTLRQIVKALRNQGILQ